MKDIVRTLTIAGTDASGGAGMAADLKTFEEFGTYGQVALTTIVTMDPNNNWAHRVNEINLDIVKEQLETILASDKPIAAMKTGMLGTPEIVKLVSDTLEAYPFGAVVIDPVLVCKGTDEVLNPDTADSIRKLLVPKATVVTPNLFEAGVLAQMSTPKNMDEMKEAAKKIYDLGCPHVVIKGGKAIPGDTATDLYYDGLNFEILEHPKAPNAYNHGAGCSFAAAITASLALGRTPQESIRLAKTYVAEAIEGGFQYNDHIGPVFLPAYRLNRQDQI